MREKLTELSQIFGIIGLISCLLVWAYFKGQEDCECNNKRIERLPDTHGNIQGDTICKPERESYGFPH